MIKTLNIVLFLIIVSLVSCGEKEPEVYEPPIKNDTIETPSNISLFYTLSNGTQRLAEQTNAIKPFYDSQPTIQINSNERYQTMDGFGFAITGGSAKHLQSMSSVERNAILTELFAPFPKGINLSFIRVSIGASDLDAEVFSYADTPNNEPDADLSSFNIEKDKQFLIPLLKQIQSINPDIKIMASPWSPPKWMKTNKSSIGGELMPEYYDSYALYFVKYLNAMRNEGLNVEFISIQNEPLHDGNNPSLYMSAAQQANFLGKHLGPKLDEENIDVKVLLYDHNADKYDYPLEVLENEVANKFAYGSAFHLYGGSIAALSKVKAQFPDKHIYFTEQWYGAPGDFAQDLNWHIREVVIGSSRNWSKGIIEWNLSSDPSLEPHTEGGCTNCLGAITVNGNNVVKNAGFYVMAHIASFVPPNSVRVASNITSKLQNVAFLTPSNQIVLLVLNDSDVSTQFSVNQNDSIMFSNTLDAGTVATFVWEND